MCIKNHTHCSVESVAERRQQTLRCRQSVNRSTVCRDLKHRTRLPRASEDRGTPFRDGLKTCSRESSTTQSIIYNTNRTIWSPLVLRKTSQQDASWSSSSNLPSPQEKRSTIYPKTSPHQISHHQCTYPDIDPKGKPPSTNPVQRTPGKGSTPRTSKRPRVDVIKNKHLKPPCHYTGTTTVVYPNQNVTYVIRKPSSPPQEPNPTKRARATFPTKCKPVVCRCDDPGLSVHWPQSGGQPDYLSLFPSTGSGKHARRHLPKGH
jgi:hypothetical protein